jgi:hypothetical protein
VFATLAAGGRWSAARALPEVGDGTARPLLMPDGEEGFYAVEPPGFRVPNITVYTVTGPERARPAPAARDSEPSVGCRRRRGR